MKHWKKQLAGLLTVGLLFSGRTHTVLAAEEQTFLFCVR